MSDTPDRPAAAPARYRLRRAPRFGPFLLTGAVIGIIAGVLVDLLGPAAPGIDSTSALAFFAVIGGLVGTLLAAIVAVLLDRRR